MACGTSASGQVRPMTGVTWPTLISLLSVSRSARRGLERNMVRRWRISGESMSARICRPTPVHLPPSPGEPPVVLGAVPCCHGVEHRLDIADALGRLKTPADACRFIQDFAAGWATPITDVHGFTDEALDAEATLGVRLPAAVRAAYRLFGAARGSDGRRWQVAGPDELRHD